MPPYSLPGKNEGGCAATNPQCDALLSFRHNKKDNTRPAPAPAPAPLSLPHSAPSRYFSPPVLLVCGMLRTINHPRQQPPESTQNRITIGQNNKRTKHTATRRQQCSPLPAAVATAISTFSQATSMHPPIQPNPPTHSPVKRQAVLLAVVDPHPGPLQGLGRQRQPEYLRPVVVQQEGRLLRPGGRERCQRLGEAGRAGGQGCDPTRCVPWGCRRGVRSGNNCR